jgi:hypothetical protein
VKRGYEAESHGERAVFTGGFDYINHRDEVKRVLILDRSVPTYYSDKDYVKPFGQWGERPYPGVNTVADILPRVTQMFDLQSEIAGYQVILVLYLRLKPRDSACTRSFRASSSWRSASFTQCQMFVSSNPQSLYQQTVRNQGAK